MCYHCANIKQNYPLIQRVLVTSKSTVVIPLADRAALATVSSPAHHTKQLLTSNLSGMVRTVRTPIEEQTKSEFLPSYVYKCHFHLQLQWGTVTLKEGMVIRGACCPSLCCSEANALS